MHRLVGNSEVACYAGRGSRLSGQAAIDGSACGKVGGGLVQRAEVRRMVGGQQKVGHGFAFPVQFDMFFRNFEFGDLLFPF